ncbi:MAG TPA: sugar phosphate isomerase/epimerase family protein [Rhizomicrobium sp.]|jgi:sugar phosphate isomerase/epimerase|nr:sugar phosphate isomerase/epimerase family protein [Rhizomicrobium sp.]
MHRIGMMQGRLLPKVGNRIQAFPGPRWKEEFVLLRELGYDAIELTIEMQSWENNPVRSANGRREISEVARGSSIFITGLCADTAMERPIVSPDQAMRREGEAVLMAMLEDCADLGLPMLEVPLMGDASLQNDAARTHFDDVMSRVLPRAERLGVDIVLESDLPPRKLADLMNSYDHPRLGINYDMGNSTWFGYDPDGELALYARHVRNIHVKDCTIGGYSVPLGSGDTRFGSVFSQLRAAGYKGDFVLQAARQDDDIGAGRDYLAFTKGWIDTLQEH